MRLIKNDEVTSSMIHKLREELKADTKQVRGWLGIVRVSDIPKDLPINKRDFNLWVLLDNDHIVGYISFKVGSIDIAFIKQLYICSSYRRRGYGRRLLMDLIDVHPKIDCTINEGNEVMYYLAETVGIRRHKPSEAILRLNGGNKEYQSKCFSNYLSKENYVE
jgi:GNAT superfamily N-acetyltransferase